MTLKELTEDQIFELKQTWLIDHQERVYWSELAAANEIVSDKNLEDAYGDIDFCNDDFFCTAEL